MRLKFTKMHGLGNDFLVARGAGELPAEAVRALADRRRGIGFDQLLWLESPRSADTDVYYRIFNADGSEAEQCGNGARCIARFVADEQAARAGAAPDPAHIWRLGFPGGVVDARVYRDGEVAVCMGEPEFAPHRIPFVAPEGEHDEYQLTVDGHTVTLQVVSMGNPHAVIRVDDVAAAPVQELGALLERHERFPNRANIGFMQVTGPAHIRLRVFERGVGETSACGTGACAAVAAGCRVGLLDDAVTVALPGGELRVRWPGEGAPVWLTGEAVRAFDGVVAL